MNFQRFPPEIRNIIYRFYIGTDGYTYDPLARKLCTPDGCPVNMSLQLTCKSIAAEMRGLAFRTNTLTFSTAKGKLWIRKANHFSSVLTALQRRSKPTMLVAMAEVFQSPEARQELVRQCPNMGPRLIEAFTRYPGDITKSILYNRCGMIEYPGAWPWSVHFKETNDALRLAAKSGGATFESCASLIPYHLFRQEHRTDGQHWRQIAETSFDPWMFPDAAALDRMDIMSGSLTPSIPKHAPDSLPAFSAAAVCIDFPESLPVRLQKYLRNIVLDEDRATVGMPESHGEGLIPYCLENPCLKIQRRVRLWDNLLHKVILTLRMGVSLWAPRRWYMPCFSLTRVLSHWVLEALRLTTLGMPPGSFSMVIDGGTLPDHATDVFQSLVHRDIFNYSPAKPEPHTYEENHINPGYSHGVVAAFRDILTKRSIVSCNFNPGQPWGIGDISGRSEAQVWSQEKWEAAVEALGALPPLTQPDAPPLDPCVLDEYFLCRLLESHWSSFGEAGKLQTYW